jgi:hypothetical protein
MDWGYLRSQDAEARYTEQDLKRRKKYAGLWKTN